MGGKKNYKKRFAVLEIELVLQSLKKRVTQTTWKRVDLRAKKFEDKYFRVLKIGLDLQPFSKRDFYQIS